MTSRDPTASYYDITLPDGTRTEVWSVLRAVLTPEEALGYVKACILTRIMRDGKKLDVDRMREAEKVGIEAGMLREAMEAYLAMPDPMVAALDAVDSHDPRECEERVARLEYKVTAQQMAYQSQQEDDAARIAELERERDEAREDAAKAKRVYNDLFDGAGKEIRALKQALTAEREAHEATRRELERVRAAVRWALGEGGEFRLRGDDEGAYWWRAELRQRAFHQPPAPEGEA